jgi:DNA-binding NarL/FixJ family response regulator
MYRGSIFMKLRVLLAEDHRVLLEGLRLIVEPECEVVGTAVDGRELVSLAGRLQPDLVLLDVAMPLLNGIEAARQIRSENPDIKLIFVTMQTGRHYVREAFDLGASGYLLKQSAGSEILTAIRHVQSGRFALSPALLEQIPDPGQSLRQNPGKLFGSLTPRQREVLQLVAEGRAAKEIAELLFVSVKTVEFHKKHLMAQLGVRGSTELVRYAVEQGWVSS